MSEQQKPSTFWDAEHVEEKDRSRGDPQLFGLLYTQTLARDHLEQLSAGLNADDTMIESAKAIKAQADQQVIDYELSRGYITPPESA